MSVGCVTDKIAPAFTPGHLGRSIPSAALRTRLRPYGNVGISASTRMALFALRFYMAYLSLLFAVDCLFEPSCSQYAYQAIERFGVGRGSWLALKRLGRCQPFSGRFGYDPVPDHAPETNHPDVTHQPCTTHQAGGVHP
jgi:uncharacterized protein